MALSWLALKAKAILSAPQKVCSLGTRPEMAHHILSEVVDIMVNMKVHSRRIFLGAAFVGAMAGTGALFGFMGGLMLVLLSHAVLRSDGATLSVLLLSGALGVAAATIWSVLLVTRQNSRTISWNPAATTPQANEGN